MKSKKLVTSSGTGSSNDPNPEAVGVTVRPRRRRRPPQQQLQSLSQPPSANDDTINFQEVSPTVHVPASQNDALDNFHEASTISMKPPSKSMNPSKVHDELTQQFRVSTSKRTSQPSIWSKHPPLIHHVITTSMGLQTTCLGNNKTKDRHEFMITSLLLEDHAIEILSDCRTLVKEATDMASESSSTSGKNDSTHMRIDDRLFVAVHALRAILCTQAMTTNLIDDTRHKNSTKIDTIRRLLYFCILHIPASTNHSNTRQTNAPLDRNYLFYLAYQAFGHTFQGYTFIISASDSLTKTRQNRICSYIVHATKQRSSFHVRFPIPKAICDESCSAEDQTGRRRSNATAMDQICIMCIVASLTLARRMVSHLQQTNHCEDDIMKNTNGMTFQTFVMTPMDCNNTNSDYNLVAETRHLILDIAVPWIRTFAMVMSSETNDSTETITKSNQVTTNYEQMIASYCRKAQRILYDMAEIATISNSPDTKLSLQGDSICALLLYTTIDSTMNDENECPDPNGRTPKLDHDDMIEAILLQQNLYDQACTYAWKLSDSYYNRYRNLATATKATTTSNITTLPLDTFHNQIGTLLDTSMTRLSLQNQNSCMDATNDRSTTIASWTSSYMEYCAYRSLHTSTNAIFDYDNCTTRHQVNCRFHSLPFHYEHACKHHHQQPYPTNEDEAFLLVFFLSRFTRFCLEHEGDDNQLYDLILQIPSEEIIDEFISQCLSDNLIDSAKRLRWYNLLCLIGLNRVAHRMVEQSKKSDQSIKCLKVARSVLSKCMSPLCIGLLSIVTNEKQQSQLWIYILSCHRLAVSMNEALRIINQSNESISELSRILLTTLPSPSWNVFDTTAKFFYGIGKKRFEFQPTVNALPPLLHAMKLFMHQTTLVSPTLIPSLKLSGRLTYIATIYKHVEIPDGAILATVLALVYDSIEVSITHPPSANESTDIISWMANFTENVVVVTLDNHTQSPRSEHRLALINSLLQLLMKQSRSTMVPTSVRSNKSNTLKSSAVVDLIMESHADGSKESCSEMFEKACNVPFNLATILSSLFSNKAIHRHDEVNKPRILMEFVKLFTELIVRFGHLLQRSKGYNADDTAASMKDYLSICHFTESLISKIVFNDNASAPLTVAMMNLVASISLVSAHPAFKFEGWMTDALSTKIHRGTFAHIDMARKLVDKGFSALTGCNDIDQSSFAVLTAIQLYRYQLSQLQDEELYGHMDFKRLQEFYDNTKSIESLTRIQELNWQICLTVTLSRLCMLLYLDGEGLRALQIAKWICSSASSISKEASVWTETVLLTLIAESSIITINATNTESFSHPFKYEEEACKLRLYARDGERKLSYVEIQFQRLLKAIRNSSETFGPEFDDIASWSSTTVYLGLSECAERQGFLETSVMYLKKCFEGCRISISATKRIKPALNKFCASWYDTRLTYISLCSLKRQVKCLYRTALLYHRMGNYRKSIEYSFGSLHSPMLEDAGLTSKSTFAQAVSLTRQLPARNSNETMVRRLYLRLKSLSCSLDSVTDQFQSDDHPCLSRMHDTCKGNDLFVNCELEAIVDMYEIVDMVSGYQYMPLRCSDTALHQLATQKFVRFSLSGNVTKLFRTVLSYAKCSDEPYLQIQYNAKLREAADALCSTIMNTNESRFTVLTWLKDISASQSCSALCRAWSYYLLGSTSFISARKSKGAFGKRKCATYTTYDMALLTDARTHFTNGLALLGTSCDLLTRNMMRSLAVTIESSTMKEYEALRCFSLINDSVGGSIRSQVLRHLQENDANNIVNASAFENSDFSTKYGKASLTFLKELEKVVPTGWRFITVAISTTDAFTGSPSADIFDSIVKPLNEILARSQQQLAGIFVEDCEDETKKENATRQWWHIRKQINSDLQEHLECVERVLLTSDAVRRVLMGPLSNDMNDSADGSDDLPCGNLAHRFEEVRNEDGMHPNDEYQKTPNRSGRQTKDQGPAKSHDGPKHTSKNYTDPHAGQECIFLILDENLVSFPFEGLSCFDGKAVCRIPSLTFAWAKLSEYGLGKHEKLLFDPQKTSYILDPESNLSGTKDRLALFLDAIQKDNDYRWNGVVGEIPPLDFLETSLGVNDGLLLYFGHGGGQQYCGQGKLESLTRQGQRALSSVILMGCGSGKLESVNTKHSKATSKLPIHYEPEGMALSYLLAGSPCVVGNLWDVTDRDIDRYSMHLLRSIYDNSSGTGKRSIAHCVADARQACKMRYIVGCAPVCYGFPIFAHHEFE